MKGLRVWGTLAAALLLAFWGVGPLSAQGDGIVVKSLEVASEFPDGIRFRLEVESPTPITEVTVRFSVVGQRAARYQRVDISSSTGVQTEFLVRTDTFERYIPPGSDIWYFLEIQAEGGRELVTEPRLFTYLDARFDWQQERQGDLSILYYGPTGSQAQTMLDTVVLTLEDMQPLLGVTLKRPVRLVMYNSISDMLDALPLVSETLRRQLVTQGQTHAVEGVILLLATAHHVVGVASHEVMHILMYEAAYNPFHPIPAWLDEGMAEYGNREPSDDYDLALAAAVAGDSLIPMHQLAAKPGLSEDIILLYGEARSFVAFLIEEHDAEGLRQVLRLFKVGMPMDEALQQAYGSSLDELENQWRRSLGASLIQVSSRQEAQLTPTPIPTLAPLTLVISTPVAGAAPGTKEEPTAQGAGGGGGFGCGASPAGAAAVDLSLVLFALGMVALAVRRRW